MSVNEFEEAPDEPLFVLVPDSDPELKECIRQAQATLGTFLQLHEQYGKNLGVYFAMKVAIREGDDTAHLWYAFQGLRDGALLGEHFQIPPELERHRIVAIAETDVEDWMINDHAVLYGGYSLRYQRSKLADDQKGNFDEHVGVKEYKDLS
jgi:uncharacterized protein YegJ (DUF2314 family)